jgi:peroxiredoxin
MLLSTPPFDSNLKAPDFTLVDVISGNQISLNEQDTPKGFVVAFICNHCPYVQEIITEFVVTAKQLEGKEIKVFAVMSNNYEFVTDDSPEKMKIFAQENSFSFPYLVDESQEVAKTYGAICTPDFFGFNAEGSMQYRGSVKDLGQAMIEIAETGKTEIKQMPSKGCSIKWK